MAKVSGKCTKCGGDLYREGGEVKCLQCGEPAERPQPFNDKNGDNKKPEFPPDDPRRWPQYRKIEVVRYAKDKGSPKASRVYGVPTNIITGWIAAFSRSGHINGEKATDTPAPERPAREKLPPLPAWSESWGDSVKVAWLETYRELRK